MKRVLVTGSGGQLGLTIQELAPEYPDLNFIFTEKSDLDITQSEEVNRIFEEFQPNYCINCAAYTKVDQAEKTPELAYEVNVNGVRNLAVSCKEYGTILIHISTDYVFEGIKKEGYSPNDKPNPINMYGRSKWEGEQIVQKELDRYFIVRTSWLYSKNYGHNFYKTILAKAKAGEEIIVTDEQRGCPTNTETLSIFLLGLIISESKDFGIKHFTDGEVMSWYEFAVRILESKGHQAATMLRKGGNYRTFAKRPENSILINT